MADKKISRAYGKEQTFGDIIYNKENKTVFTVFEFGFAGRVLVNLVQNSEGTYDLIKPYIDKNGQPQTVKLGRTFKAERRDGSVVEGLTNTALGLSTVYDKELEKNITSTNNGIWITTHKLREMQPTSNPNIVRVGYITGRFGIEIEDSEEGSITPTTEQLEETIEKSEQIAKTSTGTNIPF